MRVFLGTKACWQPNLPIGLNWSRLIKSYIDMDLNRPVELLMSQQLFGYYLKGLYGPRRVTRIWFLRGEGHQPNYAI